MTSLKIRLCLNALIWKFWLTHTETFLKKLPLKLGQISPGMGSLKLLTGSATAYFLGFSEYFSEELWISSHSSSSRKWNCGTGNVFFQKSRNDSKLGKVYEEKIEMYNSYYKKDTVCNVPRTITTHTGCLRWKVPILNTVLILSPIMFFLHFIIKVGPFFVIKKRFVKIVICFISIWEK